MPISGVKARSPKQVDFMAGVRANAAHTAYVTALDYFNRYPVEDALKRLREKASDKLVEAVEARNVT